MLIAGTQMHIVTFIFVSIEIVIFFYLAIYRLARPDNKSTSLNIYLILLLVIYNVTGGLLPDPNLPGSFFVQESIAYATGFITPCYFPYYVYKAFGLKKMKFHAFKGIYLFLVLPYFIFIIALALSNDLEAAKKFLALPVLYALWVICSLVKAIKYKYGDEFRSHESKEEVAILFLSITSWIGLPLIDYFNFGQAIEASITNMGFLLLLALEVKRHIKDMRIEHQKLIDSESKLLNWNTNLQEEVNRRTKELEKLNEQKTNNFINLVHETKTPLTLVKNYLEEYIDKYGSAEELDIIKGGVDKLTTDVINLFDIERFTKGIDVYRHDQVSDFSSILKNTFSLFEYYCKKQKIRCDKSITDNIFIKADPNAINRIVNNLIENAIKFSKTGELIEISLTSIKNKIIFTVSDTGIGISPEQQNKIFEPYYQVSNKKTSLQGMGLGLPIVKKVIDNLGGEIHVESNPAKTPGTKVIITLERYILKETDTLLEVSTEPNVSMRVLEDYDVHDSSYLPGKRSILVVEDKQAMIQFLFNKLNMEYNVFCALNGAEALKKLHDLPVIPDLILSDIMMDKMDGFAFAKIISEQKTYNHIPIIFLTAKSTPTARLKGLRLGAIDFISKPFSFDELSQKIDTVLANINKQKEAILNSAISNLKSFKNFEANGLPIDSSNFEENCKLFNLTNREIEIAKQIAKGVVNKNIAKTLFISDKTVMKHTQNIFEKVGVSNKLALINHLSHSTGNTV